MCLSSGEAYISDWLARLKTVVVVLDTGQVIVQFRIVGKRASGGPPVPEIAQHLDVLVCVDRCGSQGAPRGTPFFLIVPLSVCALLAKSLRASSYSLDGVFQ